MRNSENHAWKAIMTSTDLGLEVYRDLGLDRGVNTSNPLNQEDQEGEFLIYYNKNTCCYHYYDLKNPEVHGGLLKFISIIKSLSREEALNWLSDNYSVMGNCTSDHEEYTPLELEVLAQTELGKRIADLSGFSLEQMASDGEAPIVSESKEWGSYSHHQDPISLHALLNGLRLGDAILDLIHKLKLTIEVSNEQVELLNASTRNRKLLNVLAHQTPWSRKYEGLIKVLKEHGIKDGLPLARFGVFLVEEAIVPNVDSQSISELDSPSRRPVLGYHLSDDCICYSSPYWVRIDRVSGVLGSLPEKGSIFGLDLLGDDHKEVTITSSPFDALVLSNYGMPSVCIVTKGMHIEAFHIDAIRLAVSNDCEICLLFENSREWQREAVRLGNQFGLRDRSSEFYALTDHHDNSSAKTPSQVILELNRARNQNNNH